MESREGSRPAPTLREVLKALASELAAGGIESPVLEAERILCHVRGVERRELTPLLDRPLRPSEARPLGRAMQRRLSGEPLQHIEGTVAFRQLVLRADRRALVPRPETEQLVEEIVRWARSRRRGPARPNGVRIVPRPGSTPAARGSFLQAALDIGTGSGAVALSLVEEGIAQRVVAVDISPDALEQAAENRAAAGLEACVELRLVRSSPWEAVGPGETFDLIVSNPPYVPSAAIEDLPVEVRDHEPRVALDGGEDGLALVREIASGAPSRLRPEGALFLEIGESQGRAVRGLLEAPGTWRSVQIRRDLAGRDRFLVASL